MCNKRMHALVTLTISVPVNQLSCVRTCLPKSLQAAHARINLYGVPYAQRQFGHIAWYSTMQMCMTQHGTLT